MNSTVRLYGQVIFVLFGSGLSISFVLGSLIPEMMVIDSWYVVDYGENLALSLSLLLTG
jgi:hypothetical protein